MRPFVYTSQEGAFRSSTSARASRGSTATARAATRPSQVRPMIFLVFAELSSMVRVGAFRRVELLRDDTHDLEVEELSLKLHRAGDRLPVERRGERDTRGRRACHH